MRAATLAHGVLLAAVLPRVEIRAQDPGSRGSLVTVQVQPEVVTVGQPFTVRVRVRAPRIAAIRFPPVPDSGDAIEAIDPRAIEDAGDTVVIDRSAVYRLIAWNVGRHAPRFENVSVTSAGVEQRFPVIVSPILVRSLLPTDSALRVPKDARAPVAAPSGAWRYWLLAFVFTAGVAWYWWRRRRRRTGPEREPGAFVAAAAAFGALDVLALAAAGEPGRHLIAHVDVLRAYVARRFPAAVESLTTTELLGVLASSDFPLRPERVGDLLERESAVRFAAAPIEPATAIALSREARAIVDELESAYDARLKALDRGPRRARPATTR
jgi:hypothetical protein